MVVNFLEGGTCGYMPVVVGPTPDLQIKGPDHIARFLRRKLPDCFPNPDEECFNVAPCRSYQQFPLSLAGILPEKIKSVLYPGNPGFLRGEGQTPFPEELLYCRFNRFFKKFFGLPGDNEIIGVADYIDFGAAWSGSLDCRLQSVQSHICQNWRNDSTYAKDNFSAPSQSQTNRALSAGQ